MIPALLLVVGLCAFCALTLAVVVVGILVDVVNPTHGVMEADIDRAMAAGPASDFLDLGGGDLGGLICIGAHTSALEASFILGDSKLESYGEARTKAEDKAYYFPKSP